MIPEYWIETSLQLNIVHEVSGTSIELNYSTSKFLWISCMPINLNLNSNSICQLQTEEQE
jgi:hypothetical protein